MNAAPARSRAVTALLVAPAAVFFVFLLIVPLMVVLVFSFGERAPAGGYQPAFTFDNYLNLAARGKAFLNTLTLAPLKRGQRSACLWLLGLRRAFISTRLSPCASATACITGQTSVSINRPTQGRQWLRKRRQVPGVSAGNQVWASPACNSACPAAQPVAVL